MVNIMDIFTVKQWLFLLIFSNCLFWAYLHVKAKDILKALDVLKKDHEAIYKLLKGINEDLPH